MASSRTRIPVLDAELSQLFDDYYRQAFGQVNAVQPQYHRVIPVDQTVDIDMEVRPYESAAEIVAAAKAWAVTDCICRKQKALIGEACEHPLDVCLVLGPVPNAFDRWPYGKVLTQEEAMATLRRAADTGLVPTVSNNRAGLSYICNCCTCGCGILRGLSELGMANVVARSAFVNQVDEDACQGCESCLPRCQFGALAMDMVVHVECGAVCWLRRMRGRLPRTCAVAGAQARRGSAATARKRTGVAGRTCRSTRPGPGARTVADSSRAKRMARSETGHRRPRRAKMRH